jgi:hypothetical protein
VSPSSTLSRHRQMRERRGWRSTTDEGEGPYSQDVAKQPVGQISVQPRFEKYFASPVGQIISTNWCRPTPQRGVSQSSRTRGADAVYAAAFFAREAIAGRASVCGRSTARGREMLQRTAKSCGPDAPTLASSSRRFVGPTGRRQTIFADDGAKEPGHRGARRKLLKPLRAGTPGDSGVLVVTRVRSITPIAHEAAGATGDRHSPRPQGGER